MACADLVHEARRSSPARQRLGVLLLSAVTGLLTACGGDVMPVNTLSIGGGGGAVTCVTGGVATMLTWNAVQVATSYRVYFGTSTGNYQQPFGQGVSVIANNFQVPGLSSGTTYYFAVTAVDASNIESVYSNEVCKTV